MKRLALITVILGSALALVPFAAANVVLGDSAGAGSAANAPGGAQPTTSSGVDPATRAVLLRSQGLAAHYSSPLTTPVPLTGKALADFYDTGAMTSEPTVPLTGKALADYYDSGAMAQPIDPIGTSTIASTASSTSGDSLDVNWSALVGASLLGLLLIGMAATAIGRRKHQPSF